MRKRIPAEEIFTAVYVIFIFSFYILYTKWNYFTIIYDKYNCYMTASFVYIPLEVFAIVCSRVTKIGKNQKNGKEKTEDRDIWKRTAGILAVVLVVYIFVASFFSPFQTIVWNGLPDRKNGTLLYVVMLVSALLAAATLRYRRFYVDILMAVSIVNGIWTMTDFLDMDLFRMHVLIVDGFKRMYTGSLGQVTVFTGFYCMVLPMALLCYLSEKGKKKYFYLAAVINGFFVTYAAHSDNLVLVLGVCFLFLPALLFENIRGIRQYLLILAEFILVGRIMGLLDKLSDSEMNYLDGWGNMIASEWLGVLAMVVLVAGFLMLRRREKKGYEFLWKDYRRRMLQAAFGVIGILLLAMVFFTTIGKNINIGYTLASYFRFNDLWGTDRGFAWRRVVEAFRMLTFFYQCIGTGSDTTGAVLDSLLGEKAMTLAGQRYDNAHNEFLQYLLNYGVIGLLLYIALMGIILKRLFSSGKTEALILAAGICGYLLQSSVSLNSVFITPVFALLCALGMTAL